MQDIKQVLKQYRTFEEIMNAEPQETVFVQETDVCKYHGEYKLTFMVDGREYRRPQCPKCQLEAKITSLVKQAKIPNQFKHCTFKNFKTTTPQQDDILNQCRTWANKFSGNTELSPSIVMIGNPGTGKNHLSTAIIKTIMSKEFTALHITSIDFLDEYWSKQFSERKEWVKSLALIDLLVIDEIGRSSDTKATNDALFRIINERYQNMKPTILVSNLSQDSFILEIGMASYDRLKEFGGKLLTFAWESNRGASRSE